MVTPVKYQCESNDLTDTYEKSELYPKEMLTHWGPLTHICVSKLTAIGSDNGLSPHRRQAIIWTNAQILLTGPLETNFSEILIEVHTFSFKEIHLKMSSGKWRPFCLSHRGLVPPNQVITSHVLQYLTSQDVFVPGPSLRISDSTRC